MPKDIQIGDLKIGQEHRPKFIAEIGINHNGDLELAESLIEQAVKSGADIVKFQHHLPDYEMAPDHEWQGLMAKCRLDLDTLEHLKLFTEECGAEFLCTPFCVEAANELMDIGVKGFKTGSGEANHTPFLNYVASFNLPMLISTGMTTREELIRSLDSVRKINRQAVLLNCTSTYPAAPVESRLRRIEWLRSMFNLPVGQSDHTPTISTALGAIAWGAVCIEKHFTLDKGMNGPDHKASLTPYEFKHLVTMGLEIWEGMRLCVESDMRLPLEGEWKVREVANHSVVLAFDVKEGETLDSKNTMTARPGTGIPAYEREGLIGKRVNRDLPKGHILQYCDIADS